MPRKPGLWSCFFLVFLGATTGLAQGDTFLIETISFKGMRYNSERILRANLQLQEGQHYKESDLRQGQYRLERLRFVLHVHMALKKGSQRGAYRLEVTIEETKRWFWAAFADLAIITEDFHQHSSSLGSNQIRGRVSGLTVGKRWFMGSQGEINLFVASVPGVSYTHYNVFGRNVVSRVALQFPGSYGKTYSALPEEGRLTEVATEDSVGFTFALEVPLKHRQWFSLNYQLNTGSIFETRPLGSTVIDHENTLFRNQRTEISWRWDSKNHPLFPTRGTFISSGILVDREFRDNDPEEPLITYRKLTHTGTFAEFNADFFKPLANHQTLALGFGGRLGDHHLKVRPRAGYTGPTEDFRSHQIFAKALYAKNLFNRRFWGKKRDFRMEIETQFTGNRSSLKGLFPDADHNRFQFRVGVSGRDNFGLWRFSLIYLSTNEELWQ